MANPIEHPAASARTPRHTRADVVAAALQLLDDYGLPDLTMRRLASALDVQPSALYWHVPNKQTLLALIADEIIAHHPAGDTEHTLAAANGWAVGARAEAMALRDGLLAYRDGAEVVSSSLALGLGGLDAGRRLTDAIARGGFDPRTAEMAAAALLHFVLGHVWHEQQRLQADSLGVVADAQAASVDELAASAPSSATAAPQGSFAFGLTLLLNGLEATRPAAAAPTVRPH